MKSIFQWAGGFLLFALCSMRTTTKTGTDRPTATDTALSWHIEAGNPFYSPELPGGDFYFYISIKGGPASASHKRLPLNISLVLDRSGSMAGDKMKYARKAAEFVINQLGEEDYVSIVNYDDRVGVSSASAPVRNKELLRQKIRELQERGSTNLTGGMLEGYQQVKSTLREGYVHRVLLLTDGLANQGITDPIQIQRIAEKKYAADGIAISTFGLGADYNETLLTQLAETGRGDYYFIENPDKIPNIFAAELKGLLSVVAQNATVKLVLPPALKVVQVYGYPYRVNGNEIEVRCNDIYAADEKGMLVRCRRQGALPANMEINAVLQFSETSNFTSITSERQLKLTATNSLSTIKGAASPLVAEMLTLYQTAALFDDIMLKVDEGNYDQARTLSDSALLNLRRQQQLTPSAKLKQQEETLGKYRRDLEQVESMKAEERKIHQKANRSVNYQSRKGKLQQ